MINPIRRYYLSAVKCLSVWPKQMETDPRCAFGNEKKHWQWADYSDLSGWLSYDCDNPVNTEIILQGWIIYYYGPLGPSPKSHHFNGTFNIMQILGENTGFLSPFSALLIPRLNLSKTSVRKCVFKLNETQQFISAVHRKQSHSPTNKAS